MRGNELGSHLIISEREANGGLSNVPPKGYLRCQIADADGRGGGGNVSRADWSTMPLSRQQGREVVSPFAGRATKDPHQAKVNNNTYPIMARSEPATHCDFYALAP